MRKSIAVVLSQGKTHLSDWECGALQLQQRRAVPPQPALQCPRTLSSWRERRSCGVCPTNLAACRSGRPGCVTCYPCVKTPAVLTDPARHQLEISLESWRTWLCGIGKDNTVFGVQCANTFTQRNASQCQPRHVQRHSQDACALGAAAAAAAAACAMQHARIDRGIDCYSEHA